MKIQIYIKCVISVFLVIYLSNSMIYSESNKVEQKKGNQTESEEEAADEEEFGFTEKEKPSYDFRRPEIGFIFGASNQIPSKKAAEVVDTSIIYGLIGRVPFPFNFNFEFIVTYASYVSSTERSLALAPIIFALSYQLPLSIPVSIFVKAGAGESYALARPINRARWDHTAFLGTEASFVAGKKVRIGLRFDLMRVFETYGVGKPKGSEYPYTSPYTDPRYSNPTYYQLTDLDVFQFSLMVTFLL